ncbi:hypothetical protein, partial [Microbulbifer epialgicus]
PGPIDEDADGIKDSWEYIYFGGLDHDMSQDSDDDGISDEDEWLLGLNPSSSDSDDDGMPDLWEIDRNLNPLDSNDALLDSDDDGSSNYFEYLHDTDPNDADSDVEPYGFETNEFGKWYWKHDGSAGWTINSENPYNGSYGIRSGDISASQVSSIETAANTPDGWIYFYLSVSSESCCDKL